ncbi:substrate-binding domain-containing protein, partial [Synechococcus sp. BA-120 BA3]|nr:substrate-binding domain-containing protein [Synechococcus sp. BA-120 BA3]
MGAKQLGSVALCLLPTLAALLSACNSSEPKATSTIQISGSSTVFPVIKRAVTAYRSTEQGKTVKLELSEVGTSAGLRQFCAGEIPIANASRPISSKELKACAGNGITFIELPLAFDAITVVVNKDNTWAQAISTTCQATAKTGPDATRNLAPLCEPLTRPSAMTAVLSPLEQSSRDA